MEAAAVARTNERHRVAARHDGCSISVSIRVVAARSQKPGSSDTNLATRRQAVENKWVRRNRSHTHIHTRVYIYSSYNNNAMVNEDVG